MDLLDIGYIYILCVNAVFCIGVSLSFVFERYKA